MTCIHTELWFSELRRTYDVERQHIRLNKATRFIYCLSGFRQIRDRRRTSGQRRGEDGWGGVYLAEHLVTDQMTPMKLESMNFLDLLLEVAYSSHPPMGGPQQEVFWSRQGLSSIQSCMVNRKGLPSSIISRAMTHIQGWNAVIFISSCFSNMHLHKLDSGKRNQSLADVHKALRCVCLFFVSTYAGTWWRLSIRASCLG